jgi:hypothetical protein
VNINKAILKGKTSKHPVIQNIYTVLANLVHAYLSSVSAVVYARTERWHPKGSIHEILPEGVNGGNA